MVGRTLDWRDELGRWLKPFLARLGHKARRVMCPLYVSGLIGPGDRKSIQPMARRLVRLRLPAVSPAQKSKTEKKESTVHHLSQPCQPCAKPSSKSSLGHQSNVARIAENGFAAGGGVSNLPK
jgi:DDE superfamily endonuclease